jgi:steroid delta-isomerase-like uncharacterized protein
MSQANKTITEQWTQEIFNNGNLAAIDQLVAADIVFHIGSEPDIRGRQGLRAYLQSFRAAFPDGRFTIDEQIAEGDQVVQCWSFRGTHKGEFFGIPACGKPVAITGHTRLRVSGGKVAEHWAHYDVFGFLKQAGRSV